MDYVVGSVAALISGNVTPNRPKLIRRALTPTKHQPSPNVTPKSEVVDDRSIFLSPTQQKKKAIVKKSPKRIFQNPDLDITEDFEGNSSISSPKAEKVKKHLKKDLGADDMVQMKAPRSTSSDNSLNKSLEDVSRQESVIMDSSKNSPIKKKKKRNSEANASDNFDEINVNANKNQVEPEGTESKVQTPKKKMQRRKSITETIDYTAEDESEAANSNKSSEKHKDEAQSAENNQIEKKKNKKKRKKNKKALQTEELKADNVSTEDKENDHINQPESEKNQSPNKKKKNKRKDKSKQLQKGSEKKKQETQEEKMDVEEYNQSESESEEVKSKNTANPNAITEKDSDSEHDSDNEIDSEEEHSNKKILTAEKEDDSSDEEKENPKDKKKNKTEQKDKEVNSEEEIKRTLFVGNVPFSNKCKKEIKKIFNKYGQIETVRIRTIPVKDARVTPKLAVIKNELHPERSTVNVYIKYAEEASVTKALSENNTVVRNHHLRVSRSQSSGAEHDPSRAVFVGNLPFAIEDETLRAKFQNCGEIESVRIVRDKKTNAGKGFGYVNFASKDGVELALGMSEEDLTIKNRILRVKRCSQTQSHGQKEAASSRQAASGPAPRRGTHREQTGALKRIMNKRKLQDGVGDGPPNKRQKNINQPNKEKKTRKEFVGMTSEKKKKQKFNKGQKKKKALSEILTKKS